MLLRVADSGAGIDPDSAEEVFRRGWRAKPAEGPAGRGLGLALVGQAVRRHGGTIEVSRDVGRGVHRAPARAGGPMIRVLVVEDDPVVAEAHRRYVERVAGFAVAAVAHSGA